MAPPLTGKSLILHPPTEGEGSISHQREVLHLSFALADTGHLERLSALAGLREISVTQEVREGSFESFEDYWAPIEEAAGSLPQAYRALPESSRRAVREEVRARLVEFESGGRLVMSVEMLIAAGCVQVTPREPSPRTVGAGAPAGDDGKVAA